MKTISCDACGSSLTMTESGTSAVCNCCGMNHSIERIRVKVQEIKGAAEELREVSEKERLLKNAETFIVLNEEEKATEIYRKVTIEYPNDYRGWMGIARINMNALTSFLCSINSFISSKMVRLERDRLTSTAISRFIVLNDIQSKLKILDTSSYNIVCEFEEHFIKEYNSLGLSADNLFICGVFECSGSKRCSPRIQKWISEQENNYVNAVVRGTVLFEPFDKYRWNELSDRLKLLTQTAKQNAKLIEEHPYLIQSVTSNKRIYAQKLTYCIGKTLVTSGDFKYPALCSVNAEDLKRMITSVSKPISYCNYCGWNIRPFIKRCPVCDKIHPQK